MLVDERIVRGMEAQLRLLHQRLDAGDRLIGWKVGFGSPSAMARLGISVPLVGFITEGVTLRSGSTCSLQDWTMPLLEPEIQLLVGRDVPAGSDDAVTQESIAGIGAAIELADVRGPSGELAELLAKNMFNRHVLLGPINLERRGGFVDGVVVKVIRNQVEVASTDDPQALTGRLADVVRGVANALGAVGEVLRASQIVIAGSVVRPLAVLAGDSVRVEMRSLGALEVNFAAHHSGGAA